MVTTSSKSRWLLPRDTSILFSCFCNPVVYPWSGRLGTSEQTRDRPHRCEGLSLLSVSLKEVLPVVDSFALHPRGITVSFARTSRRPLPLRMTERCMNGPFIALSSTCHDPRSWKIVDNYSDFFIRAYSNCDAMLIEIYIFRKRKLRQRFSDIKRMIFDSLLKENDICLLTKNWNGLKISFFSFKFYM